MSDFCPTKEPEAALAGLFTSGQFARRVGVHRNTVQYWRRTGALMPVVISPTNRGYYSEEQVQMFLARKTAEKSGE